MKIGIRIGSFLLAVLAAGVVIGQDQAAPEKATKKTRLHVIGASVSGGFEDGPLTGGEQGESVTMQHVLKAWCGEHARASTHNPLDMAQLFLDAEGNGTRQVEGAKKQKADVVVAVDFLFWFAYGPVAGDEAAARSAKFEKGLALVASLGVPVVVGDLADMRGAAPRMLRASWVPKKEVLAKLNERLAAFAQQNPNLKVVPLAALVRTMKDEGVDLPLAAGKLRASPGSLLQGDRLHANRLGMAFLGYSLQDTLAAQFPDGHPLRGQKWTLDQFVDACGAGPDVEALQEAATKAAAAPAGKDKGGAK
ncbi:MAG: hypothetical protein JNK15_22985 [Planctomycetes bacterium]|nr:hypothetical protein [Planctomycetota bacterium]